MRAGQPCRGDHALHRHRRIRKRDVVADRAIEQHVLLEDHADLPPQPRCIDHREIDAVDQDAPALRHVESLDELGQGALAGARRADDADHLAGGHVEIDIVQHFRTVDPVAKGDVVEFGNAPLTAGSAEREGL